MPLAQAYPLGPSLTKLCQLLSSCLPAPTLPFWTQSLMLRVGLCRYSFFFFFFCQLSPCGSATRGHQRKTGCLEGGEGKSSFLSCSLFWVASLPFPVIVLPSLWQFSCYCQFPDLFPTLLELASWNSPRDTSTSLAVTLAQRSGPQLSRAPPLSLWF